MGKPSGNQSFTCLLNVINCSSVLRPRIEIPDPFLKHLHWAKPTRRAHDSDACAAKSDFSLGIVT
jgi:hypothetical protein